MHVILWQILVRKYLLCIGINLKVCVYVSEFLNFHGFTPFYTVENIVTARSSYVSYVLIRATEIDLHTLRSLTKCKWPRSIIIVNFVPFAR